MGLIRMYRDHTGIVVISEHPIHPGEFN